MVDVSHASKRTFWDLVEASTTPVFSSHSGCEALKAHPRNLDDEQLRAVGQQGGVVGVIFAANFLGGLLRVDGGDDLRPPRARGRGRRRGRGGARLRLRRLRAAAARHARRARSAAHHADPVAARLRRGAARRSSSARTFYATSRRFDVKPVLHDMTPAELGELPGAARHLCRRGAAHLRAPRAARPAQLGRANTGARKDCARARRDWIRRRCEVVDRRRCPADGFTKYLFRARRRRCASRRCASRSSTTSTRSACRRRRAARSLRLLRHRPHGLQRNLATWEIVEQLRIVRDEADRPVRGVVFMGMGEPFLNYDNVIRAARIFADPSGARHQRARHHHLDRGRGAGDPPLHRRAAPVSAWRSRSPRATRTQRRSLMPAAEKTWPIDELIDAVREHAAATRDRVTLEYVVIARRQLRRRRRRGAGRAAARHAGAASTSSTSTTPPAEFTAARATRSERAFLDALQPLGAPIVRRYSGGKDVNAACGMLAATG